MWITVHVYKKRNQEFTYKNTRYKVLKKLGNGILNVKKMTKKISPKSCIKTIYSISRPKTSLLF